MKILVAIDGSDEAKAAYDCMLSYVKDGDEVFVVGVAEDFAAYVMAANLSSLAAINEEERIHTRNMLGRYGKDLSSKGVKHTSILGKGKAADVICEEAALHNVDVIFMGRRNMSTMERTFSITDSISSHVLHHAPCSVFIAKFHSQTNKPDHAVSEIVS